MKLYIMKFSVFCYYFQPTVYRLISTVPEPSLQSFYIVTEKVSHLQLQKYFVKYTCSYSNSKFSESRKESKTL